MVKMAVKSLAIIAVILLLMGVPFMSVLGISISLMEVLTVIVLIIITVSFWIVTFKNFAQKEIIEGISSLVFAIIVTIIVGWLLLKYVVHLI